MSLVRGTGGDLDSIGEEVTDTDDLPPKNSPPVVKKSKLRRQSSGLVKLRNSLHKIAELYDPKNDKTVVSINVAVRCRPFSERDRLAFFVDKNESKTDDDKQKKNKKSDSGGELRLLNLDGKFVRQTRYGFTYVWWSAHNYQRYLEHEEDIDYAKKMHVTSQYEVYEQVGRQAMSDLVHGHSVVMFAYGLSGSGKTYTVFGPDDPLAPEAWFKHKFVHDLWGLFPRVAYHLFAEKRKHEGWRVTIKYFQNVVNTIRDLLSPSGEEKSDKTGLHKDRAGFMDVTWASKVVVNNWEDLRTTIQQANTRKAISPTQFNHQSTRGHCILIMEVETTNTTHEKQKGRLYVCDLAGAEPAGDIVYAQYKKDKNGDDVFVGKHPDESKTKALKAQGQKINLSLSEMTNFFRKMAAAVKSNRLKPGQSIPGCNNYFLGRFLKETMLKSKTYLFCAVRPETKFLNYTLSTLQFAATASVVKLKPKKPLQRKMTKHELKLFQELQALKKQFIGKGGHALDGRPRTESSMNLLNDLHAKRQELDKHHIDNFTPEEIARKKREETQKKMLHAKGIEMASSTSMEKKNNKVYFINIDEDKFLSKRFIYPIQTGNNDITVFGVGGKVQPTVHGLVADHCSFKYNAHEKTVTLIGGKGPVTHNGDDVVEGHEIVLKHYDRVIISKLILLFFNHNANKKEEEEGATKQQEKNNSSKLEKVGVDDNNTIKADNIEIAEPTVDFIMKEYEEAATRRNQAQVGKAFNPVLLNLQSKMRQLNDLLALFGREDSIGIELFMEEELDEDCLNYSNNFRCRAISNEYNYTHKMDEMDLDHCLAILSEEKQLLKNAFENGHSYTVPETHDPFHVLFDHPQRMGYACINISVLDESVDIEQHVVSPENGVPIYPLTKEHANDPIGNIFLTVSYAHIKAEGEVSLTAEGEEDGNDINIEQALSCSISIYHADIQSVVTAIDGRYKFEDQLFEFHGHFSPGEKEGNDPDFDYIEQHIFSPGKSLQEKIYINFYSVPKHKFMNAFPISTENQRILRSFELHNEIGSTKDGESLYDKNFQLTQQVKELKKKVTGFKMKVGLARTKNDGLLKRHDDKLRQLDEKYKKQLQDKDEEIITLNKSKQNLTNELKEVAVLHEQLTDERAALSQTQHDLETTTAHFKAKDKALGIFKAKLAEEKDEKDAAILKIAKLEQEIREKEIMERTMKKQEKEEESKVSKLRMRISFLNTERGKLQKDIEETHFELKKLEFANKSHTDDIEKSKEDFKVMTETYQKTLQTKMGEVASLYEEVISKNNQIASLSKKLQLTEEKNSLLQKKLDHSLSRKTNDILHNSYNDNNKQVEVTKSHERTLLNGGGGGVREEDHKQQEREETINRFNDAKDNYDNNNNEEQKSTSSNKKKTTIPHTTTNNNNNSATTLPTTISIASSVPSEKLTRKPNTTNTLRKKKKIFQSTLSAASYNEEILIAAQPLVNNLNVHNLENIFRQIQHINIQASKDLRSVLKSIISSSMLNADKGHLYIALMEKLFARPIVTRWQQGFIRTGLIDGEFFWQDGANGQIYGPFSDSLEALRHAVQETNPKMLLHQICLKELENTHVDGFDNIEMVNLIIFMSKMFDHEMLPATVMQQLLLQLIQDNNTTKRTDKGSMSLTSVILEIIYRCLMAGSVKLGNNVVTYLKMLKRRTQSMQLSRRDTFLIRKLSSSIHLSGFEVNSKKVSSKIR